MNSKFNWVKTDDVSNDGTVYGIQHRAELPTGSGAMVLAEVKQDVHQPGLTP